MAQNRYDGIDRRVPQLHDVKPKIEVQPKKRFEFEVQPQARPRGVISPATSPQMNTKRMFQAQQKQWKYFPRVNQTEWAYTGPKTQAPCLGSGPKPCGTGVFIPQTGPTKASNHQFIKKPEQVKDNVKNDDEKAEKKKMEDDVIYISPDAFLPKEWTY